MKVLSNFVKVQMIERCSTQEIVALLDKMEENVVNIQTQLAEKDKEISELYGIIGITKGLLKDARNKYNRADKKDLCIDFIISTLEDDQ